MNKSFPNRTRRVDDIAERRCKSESSLLGIVIPEVQHDINLDRLQLLAANLAVQANEFYGKHESRVGRDDSAESTRA